MRDTAQVIADLNDLLQLDHDAVEAYTVAIDTVRGDRYREALVEYRGDHKRHIEELAALVRARGGLPTELPHPTGALKLVVQALGSAGSDTTLLLAFKAVEGQARDKYRRFAGNEYPDDVREVVVRGADDESRHYAWVEQTLRELGAGAGTFQHAAASAVEMLHKFVADPLERAERDVMRAVGNVVGTTRSRGGSAAPSPADVANVADVQRVIVLVDDLDGSVVEYKITHDADGFGTPSTMTRDDLLELIRDAGFRPVERNTRYETVREYDAAPSLAERRAEPQQVWA